MRIEGSHGSTSQSQSDTIHEVLGDIGVHRSEIELALLTVRTATYLHVVLHQGLHEEDDILESLRVFHAVDKAVHRRFTLCEVHLPVFVPVGLVAVHGIHIVPYLGLTLEEYLRQFIEGIVGKSGIPHHEQVLQHTVHMQFGYHIVFREHPFAVVEPGVFLLYLHILHIVHIGIVRHVEIAFLHVQRTVCENVQLSTETEVLRIGRYKLEMIAEVSLYIHRVFYIIMVEGDARSADRRRERILQQAHVVVVDIHIGEGILEGSVEYLAGLDYLSDTIALLALDDVFLCLRILAIDVLRNRLVDAHRKGKLAVIGRGLHLVQKILSLAEELAFQLLFLQVVEGKRYLLILVILIVIMIAEIGLFLGSYHSPHQLHGRVVLTTVFASLGLHHHLVELMAVVLQLYFYEIHFLVYADGLRLVAQGRYCEHPAWMFLDGELTLTVAGHGYLMPAILHAGIGNGKSILIYDSSCYLLLGHQLECRNQQQHNYEIQFSKNIHTLLIYRRA